MEKTYVVTLLLPNGESAGQYRRNSPEAAQDLIDQHQEATGGSTITDTFGGCECGQHVLLAGFVNECGCGDQYSFTGQRLQKSEYSDYDIAMGLDN